MENKTVISIETVIGYIEDHLSGKLDLETVATAVNYSKYHCSMANFSCIFLKVTVVLQA